MRILQLMLWAILGSAMLGCGQKGPLVLPDAQRPRKQISIPRRPAAKPAPSGTTTPATPGTPAGTAAPAPAPGNPAGNPSTPDAAPPSG